MPKKRCTVCRKELDGNYYLCRKPLCFSCHIKNAKATIPFNGTPFDPLNPENHCVIKNTVCGFVKVCILTK